MIKSWFLSYSKKYLLFRGYRVTALINSSRCYVGSELKIISPKWSKNLKEDLELPSLAILFHMSSSVFDVPWSIIKYIVTFTFSLLTSHRLLSKSSQRVSIGFPVKWYIEVYLKPIIIIKSFLFIRKMLFQTKFNDIVDILFYISRVGEGAEFRNWVRATDQRATC